MTNFLKYYGYGVDEEQIALGNLETTLVIMKKNLKGMEDSNKKRREKKDLSDAAKHKMQKARHRITALTVEVEKVRRGTQHFWNGFWEEVVAADKLRKQACRRQAVHGEKVVAAEEEELDKGRKRTKAQTKTAKKKQRLDESHPTPAPTPKSTPTATPAPTPSSTPATSPAPVYRSPSASSSATPRQEVATPTTPSKIEGFRSLFCIPAASERIETPNKAKLSDAHAEAIKKNVLVAISTTIGRKDLPLPPDLVARFEENRRANRELASLRQLPCSFEAIVAFLKEAKGAGWVEWDEKVYAHKLPSDASKMDRQFWRIARYALISAHERLAPGTGNGRDDGHERTGWVGAVVPWFAPLRQTALLTFQWCETPYTSRNVATLTDGAYKTQPKMYADGIGIDPTSRMERLLMEASSGQLAEDILHSQGDAIKLLENAVRVLQGEIADHKEVAFATMRRRTVMAVQSIKTKMTLTFTSIGANGHIWETIEVRSAQLPTAWKEMTHSLRVLELIATIYLELYKQEEVSQTLSNEKSGMVLVEEEETVRVKIRM
ncbi:hypothetical protein HK104_002794 [Borealophlyctis nickersoniae]|nr:hypothetical protein HK104_002794 [Borealophlyctis nickersoniae]